MNIESKRMTLMNDEDVAVEVYVCGISFLIYLKQGESLVALDNSSSIIDITPSIVNKCISITEDDIMNDKANRINEYDIERIDSKEKLSMAILRIDITRKIVNIRKRVLVQNKQYYLAEGDDSILLWT